MQPPEPLDLWKSNPFDPVVRDGNLYARGAVDDKGQVLTHVKAIEAFMETVGDLPINVKMIIEGEEEIGSPHLEPLLAKHKDRLAADYVVISDTAMFAAGVPSLCEGLRGLVYIDVVVRGPKQDLHSGGFGNVAANPANALAKIIADLKADNGWITIPGFYDDVKPVDRARKAEWARLEASDAGRAGVRGGALQVPGRGGTPRRTGLRPAGAKVGPADTGRERPVGRLSGAGQQDDHSRVRGREGQPAAGARPGSQRRFRRLRELRPRPGCTSVSAGR